MGNRTRQVRWIMAGGAVLLVALLIYFSIGQANQRYEVCMTFKGRVHCATSLGATQAEAIRSAQEIDCELLSNGRDELMVCLDTQPSSVRPVRPK